MKFSIKALMAILMGICAFTACVTEDFSDSQMSGISGNMYLATVDGADTKAMIDGTVSKWNGAESIAIIGKKGTYEYTASVPSPSTSAVFNYSGSGNVNESEVMAVYPYGNYSGDFGEMSVSNVTVPTEQTPTAGSYDPDAAVAVAHTSGNTLKFRNAVSLLKFTVGSDGVKNVTVFGEMTEVPGGEYPDYYVEGNVYLTVHNDWKSDGARFAAYFWNGSSNTWKSMTAVAGQENMYTCAAPSGYANVIFCRMNGGSPSNNWDNKWNQTVDLALSGGNHFTISNPWDSANESKATGSWATISNTTTLGISGTGKLYYNEGQPVLEGMSTGYVSMTGNFVKGQTYYMAVAPVVFEKGITVEFSKDGNYNKFPVKTVERKVELKRNVIYDLGTLYSTDETGFFTDPPVPDADQPCTIFYRPAEDDALYSHTGDLYAHVWITGTSAGSSWGDNSSKYKMTKQSGQNLWTMDVTQTLRQWIGSGTNSLQAFGILARTADKTKQSGDYVILANDGKYSVDTPMAPLPSGVKHGINYIDDNTVTLVLYDKNLNGEHYGFCNLLWDENWWGDSSRPKKPMNYDEESGCWWITLTGLDPDKQYKFQYQLGYGSFPLVQTFDPYTEILYDRSNDQYISSSTYPGLAGEYGDTHYGRDYGFVSAFKINGDEYDWKYADYKIEDEDDLVIYEMLFRDFTDNSYGEGSVKAALNELDYISGLGVNAVELMPIQEFDGNDSWGYGTHAYFAMDKAYGTREDYKTFIDECHRRGMAVILDVVYNHATGAHPYAAMYWDSAAGKTASDNPWFNVNPTHEYNVFHQWNHSNKMVREHVKRNLEYLIKEYKVDGFRFDLTKGFTQNSNLVEVYNDERVGYLKEYYDHIKSVDANAVMICEHFVDDENWELGNHGIKVWRNMNSSYNESAMGWMSKADFNGLQDINEQWVNFGTLVGYMESHDEERAGYKALTYGSKNVKESKSLRMKRAGLNAAFFLLVPGPKMIWQFGEIGYDTSIFYNWSDGIVYDGNINVKTSKKPYKKPAYFADSDRKALYDTYAMLLKFRKDNPRFFDSDVEFRWGVGADNQTGRYIFSKSKEDKHFALFGNFGSGSQTINVTLPEGVSKWYQYDNGAEWPGSQHGPKMNEGDFYLLVSDQSMCL